MLVLTLMTLSPARTATASESEWRASWLLDVDFANNEPNVTLTVQVWDPDNVLDVQVEPLSCAVWSGVKIQNEMAVFSGTGGRGIRCSMPSLHDVVLDMTGGVFDLPEECSCKSDAEVEAWLAPEANLGPRDFPNPVFYLSGMQFSTPIAAGDGLHTAMTLRVDGQSARGLFLANATANHVSAAFSPGENDNEYIPVLAANGVPLIAVPAGIHYPLAVSNVQPALYIGYHPNTGTVFNGTIARIKIDPGCVGND